MKRAILFLLALALGVPARSQSREFTPPVNKNATLRYWMAFADLEDHRADESTSKLMEDVLAGTANWDEGRLGHILDENTAAVLGMQRASDLPECHWGLEYSRGASMSVGHLPKARVLARLNALYGARQMAKGDVPGAVTSWLAGLRFAQCVAKDVGLIGILSAKPAFLANVHLLVGAAQKGLDVDSQQKVRAQILALPAEGLDWPGAIRAEAWADEEALRYFAKAPNFQEAYKDFYSTPPAQAAHPPTDAEIAAFHNLMNDVVAAFQLPFAQTQEKLKTIMARTEKMNPAVQSIIPSYSRMNDARQQVASEQARIKALVGSK
jgi:hypothetical protein